MVQDTAWKGQDFEPVLRLYTSCHSFRTLVQIQVSAPGADIWQDMLVLKYGLELDELDFINKAKAVMLQPILQAETAFQNISNKMICRRMVGPDDMVFPSDSFGGISGYQFDD